MNCYIFVCSSLSSPCLVVTPMLYSLWGCNISVLWAVQYKYLHIPLHYINKTKWRRWQIFDRYGRSKEKWPNIAQGRPRGWGDRVSVGSILMSVTICHDGHRTTKICCHSTRFCRHGDETERRKLRAITSVEAPLSSHWSPGAWDSGRGASTGKSSGSSYESFKISSQIRFWVSLTENETYLTRFRKRTRRNRNLASPTSL